MRRTWIVAVLLAARPAAGEIRFGGEIGAEVEVFHERYRPGDVFEYLSDPSAYEETYATTTLESDATRTSGVLGLRLDAAGGKGSLHLDNEYAHGPELLRDEFAVEAAYTFSPRRTLRLTDRVDLRRDLEGSLIYDSDLQHAAAAEFRADSLGGLWSLRVRDEFSNARVDGDSLGRLFDYDRNRAALLLERGGRGVRFGGEGSLIHKETPSGVTGAYREAGARFFGRSAGVAWFWSGEGSSQRRDYHDRSFAGGGGWTHEARASVGYDAVSWGIEGTHEASFVRYDEPDEVYLDYVENRSAIRGRRFLGERLTVEIEPAFEMLRAEGSQGYDEPALEAAASLDVLADGWIRLSGRLGRRDYGGGADSTLSVSFGGIDLSLESSDYVFGDASMMARSGVGAGVAVEVYLDYTIEHHEADDEDFSLFSFTASVSRRF